MTPVSYTHLSPQVVVNYLQGRHTYTWDSKVLGGRFEDNPNAWWTFNVEETYNTPAGTLKAGTDNQNPCLLYTSRCV